MGTNRTHRSHARFHPYRIPQPVKVSHTIGAYVPSSFRAVVWVLLRPTKTDQWKCCETGPTGFRAYPRRLESLTFCRCHYKGSTFFLVIQWSWVLVRPGFETATSRSADRRSPNWANQAVLFSLPSLGLHYLARPICSSAQCNFQKGIDNILSCCTINYNWKKIPFQSNRIPF